MRRQKNRNNKLTLESAELYGEILIGLILADKIWRVCWQMNQSFLYDLAFTADEDLNGAEVYRYEHPEEKWIVRIIPNKQNKQYFLPQARQFTHFVQLTDTVPSLDIQDYVKKLNRLPGIQFAADITSSYRKNG